MNRSLAVVISSLMLTGVAAAAGPDSQMDRYFSIWADNARVTPEAVDQLYASRVVYYGKPMTQRQVYQDKLNYIRQWPSRRYSVLPGSVSKSCDAAQAVCRIYAILAWEKADAVGQKGSRGSNTIVLTLKKEDGGELKIARESGAPVVHSACRGAAGRWSCSGFH